MAAPLPDGSQAARAMTMALRSAAIQAPDIGYLNAHASSTGLNDPTETLAIKTAFGPAAGRLPISGTKGTYGHRRERGVRGGDLLFGYQSQVDPADRQPDRARSGLRSRLHPGLRPRGRPGVHHEQFVWFWRDQRHLGVPPRLTPLSIGPLGPTSTS